MKLGEKANALVEIRAAITKVEEEFEKVMLPLKEEKAKLQEEMITGLKEIGTATFKTLDKKTIISLAERKSLQILNEDTVVAHLKRKKLKDLFKIQIVKPLFKGYASEAIKSGVEIPGTAIGITEYISVRSKNCKSNCRWATPKEQNNNRRDNIKQYVKK